MQIEIDVTGEYWMVNVYYGWAQGKTGMMVIEFITLNASKWANIEHFKINCCIYLRKCILK